MQFRWEKDWPTMFGYLTGINEGIVAYLVADKPRARHPDDREWRAYLEGLTVVPFLDPLRDDLARDQPLRRQLHEDDLHPLALQGRTTDRRLVTR